jgi:hypothetical protein
MLQSLHAANHTLLLHQQNHTFDLLKKPHEMLSQQKLEHKKLDHSYLQVCPLSEQS